jgi:hypothetical protein
MTIMSELKVEVLHLHRRAKRQHELTFAFAPKAGGEWVEMSKLRAIR